MIKLSISWYICRNDDTLIRTFLHITLAFLVLIGTTSLTIKKHYCQQKLESISLLPTNSCCKSKAHSACKKVANSCKKGCCSDETVHIENDLDLKFDESEVFSSNQIKDVKLDISSNSTNVFSKEKHANFLTYKPPIVFLNISTLFQVFRL